MPQTRRMSAVHFFLASAVAAVLLGAGAFMALRSSQYDVASSPLRADGSAEIILLDPTVVIDTDSPPAGWFHRTFWFKPAMQLAFLSESTPPSIRCDTNAGASIFGRHTDIDLGTYWRLAWSWRVDRLVNSRFDERTRASDDHAARLFFEFRDEDDGIHHLEIVWSNGSLQAGSFKHIGGFAHYVAQSGRATLKPWIEEDVDLWQLYRVTSGRKDRARLTRAAIFCDTDDTGLQSRAFFGKIVLRR